MILRIKFANITQGAYKERVAEEFGQKGGLAVVKIGRQKDAKKGHINLYLLINLSIDATIMVK